jgi:polyisoprenyl-phosphate glycosyltransferase
LRVLMPVALALLAATFVKLVADLVRFDLHVASSTVLVGLAACNIMAIALLADLVVRRTGSE